MEKIWTTLYEAAKGVLNPRQISPWMEAGGVGAAVESVSGKIYVGVCVDTACTLGVCAERNAIFNMITNGESAIRRVIAVNGKGKAIPPCGACREFFLQLSEKNREMEILVDLETRETVRLEALMPNWWGWERCGQSKKA